MQGLRRKAVLLELASKLRQAGNWCGETHIQKATYFLQELNGVPLGFQFILYKHGPYSFDLKDELLIMLRDGVLKVQPQPYPYGSSIVSGDYGQQLKKHFPVKYERPLAFVVSGWRPSGLSGCAG